MNPDQFIVRATDLQEGMEMVFDNPRFNYVIEEVRITRDGEVCVIGHDGGLVEFYRAADWVQVAP
jgi:hypothetical protein